jgi:hypothetical protein
MEGGLGRPLSFWVEVQWSYGRLARHFGNRVAGRGRPALHFYLRGGLLGFGHGVEESKEVLHPRYF